MTLLAVPVFGHSIAQIRHDVAAATGLGADLIELRVDLMEGVPDEEIRSLRDDLPDGIEVVLTIRNAAEGGQWDGHDDERISRLIDLAPVADFIDVELATWRRSANIRGKIRLALGRTGADTPAAGQEGTTRPVPRGLILSAHDFSARPPTLQADLLAMLDASEPPHRDNRIPKLAWRARTVRDCFEAFELMRQGPCPMIAICMGAHGVLSRILAPKFGAFATFAALTPDCETAPGQLTLAVLKDIYRWDTINANTRVYGVIGDPVEHSLSPRAHNAAFAQTAENAVYCPIQVNPSYESFKAFLAEVLARPWLDFRGFSVTLPHKENALRYIRETGGRIDPLADRIGAVNTLTLTAEGDLAGHNTDGPAALSAIRSSLARTSGTRAGLAGLRVAVLGAGGVARAVAAGLVDAHADVTLFNRTEAKARSLAGTLGCRQLPWNDRVHTEASLIVNCTSVGLWPAVHASPMPAEALTPAMSVFDTVYHPAETQLIRDAARRGCTTIDGLTMFALQAQAQFALWTGHTLPPAVFRRAAETGLDHGATPDS